jgi:phosphate transport system substrate-binding protein
LARFKNLSKKAPGGTINYRAKGSGAGVQDFIHGTVDFAASDAAMTDAEIEKVKSGVVLLPMTAGNIVLAYNLPGSCKVPEEIRSSPTSKASQPGLAWRSRRALPAAAHSSG